MPESNAVILFHSTSHAIRAERILREAGIRSKMIPVPRHISSDCGVCIRVSRSDAAAAQHALVAAGVEIAGVHQV
jgi:hypothetical protein